VPGRVDLVVCSELLETGRIVAQGLVSPDRTTLVTSGGHRIEAEVIVTAHAPHSEGRLGSVATPHIAHVVGVHLARGALAQALYRDARAFPIDASLLSHGRGAGEVLLVGGEDPPGDEDHTAYRSLGLERWARERFPGAGPVVHRGTVQAVHERELSAFTRERAGGVQACARGGSALTRTMLDALAIAGLVEGADTPWPELYLRPAPTMAQPAATA
jgi:hypothetical protein